MRPLPQLNHARPRAAPSCLAGRREAAEVQHMRPQDLQEALAARSAGANEDVQFIDVREAS